MPLRYYNAQPQTPYFDYKTFRFTTVLPTHTHAMSLLQHNDRNRIYAVNHEVFHVINA